MKKSKPISRNSKKLSVNLGIELFVSKSNVFAPGQPHLGLPIPGYRHKPGRY